MTEGQTNHLLRSTTLMVPCPWASPAMQFLAAHPEIPFGIHLTVISDFAEFVEFVAKKMPDAHHKL